MRILHFSDFHLNGNKIHEAESNLKYMLNALNEINNEKSIDLVIFSGDMLERGGEGYNKDLKKGFADFKDKVIKPIIDILDKPLSRFVFAPGNHDINCDADNPRMERSLNEETSTLQGIIGLTKASDVDEFTKRIDDFKSFEKEYYEKLEDVKYVYGKFVSTFEFTINDITIGISSLNTVWRCGKGENNKIVLGINQITECNEHLNNKDVKIALTHYPISFLSEVEREDVRKLCAEHFDILFCGHSHAGYVNFQAPYRDNAFFEINTAGTLAANTYDNDIKYKNAFQIIDIDCEGKYVIQNFKQINYQKYELDRNEFPNGRNERIYPNAEHLIKIYEEQQRKINDAKEEHVKLMLHPFESINDFVARLNNEVMKSKFQTSDKLDEIRYSILNSKKDCRLMALSGMGKTRIIAETFKGLENVYYSREGRCIEGLNALIKYKKPNVIIVDNCNQESMRELYKCIEESGKQVRLITIYNVLKPEEQKTKGELYVLDYTITHEIVDKIITDGESFIKNDSIIQTIKSRSGNIPYMAILLLNAYRNNNTLTIEGADNTLHTILSGSAPLQENTYNVLKAISLFEPLGYEKQIKDEYEFLVSNDNIHHIALEQNPINRLFKDTINDFINRQLIEREGYCIRIRPRPLAEWLTETWLIEYGNDMPDILEKITSLDEGLSQRLLRSLNNRFKEMISSLNAQKVFDIINNPEKGSFHNERIAFSKSGSQLFLSMGLVSPVMVARNLFSLINNKSINWLKNEMDIDARRNLVWALENISMDADAFIDGAKCLARLAVSENEHFSNNATGQFLQLFHLYLSGTQADLQKRITLLQTLRTDDVYLPLLTKAIDSAFKSMGFSRILTSGDSVLSENPIDYQPRIDEVHLYWEKCAEILMKITTQDETLTSFVIDMLPNHVNDFSNLRQMTLLYGLIEHYGKPIEYQWPCMRDNLSTCFNFRFKGTNSERDKLQEILIKMTPKTLLGRVKASIVDNNIRIGGDIDGYNKQMIELMSPFADDFFFVISDNVDEVEELVLEDNLYAPWLIKCIAYKMNEENLANGVFGCLLNIVLRQSTTLDNHFIVALISLAKDVEAINSFKLELLHKNYKNLYSSIAGVLDTENHSLLFELMDGYKNGLFDDKCINNYLRYYNLYSTKNAVEIFEILYSVKVSAKDVIYPYILNFLPYNLDKEDKISLEKYKDILLLFDFNDSYPHLTSQVVDAMCEILRNTNSNDFAKKIHRKVVEYVSMQGTVVSYIDHIYFDILPKYQDDILEDLCNILSSEDRYQLFYYKMYNYLGSGFDFGAGPLFQCDNEKLKEYCLKYPSVLPQRFAQMCPVYKYSKDGTKESFSDFFLWLCDNFGDKKDMLNSFSSNMKTYSWSGFGCYSDFISESIPSLQSLLSHENLIVREWAISELEYIRKESLNEKNNEIYERMIIG